MSDITIMAGSKNNTLCKQYRSEARGHFVSVPQNHGRDRKHSAWEKKTPQDLQKGEKCGILSEKESCRMAENREERIMEYQTFGGKYEIPVVRCGFLCVGSGAAAWNGAQLAAAEGMTPVCLVTEGVQMGTSRNTGSDKQTYYKQSTAALRSDSAIEMAQDYFSCGAMHGDLCLTEACGSLAAFFRLVSLGVPFPHDRYGEYTGYRTDHDEKCRATSLGPLTSRVMTEKLETAAMAAGVRVYDGYRAMEILVHERNGMREAYGIAAIAPSCVTAENPAGLCVFLSPAILWATGGPSALYQKSVYPESQTGSSGIPLLSGVRGTNLTEFQYGTASLSFRWNVSGSYQQVLPRYVSTDAAGGDAREFLPETFGSAELASQAVFRKGYEWPFSPEKLSAAARSAMVDMAVFGETSRGRRVWMDFRQNPDGVEMEPARIGTEAYEYLKNSGALDDTPIRRLRAMNEKAYRLYLDHGIDLETEMLEIGVCAQHMNGGLECDIWYESPTLRRFFPCGEVSGVFGIRRPGGSALNNTQVSSRRAVERAAYAYRELPDIESVPDTLPLSLRFASLLSPDGMTEEAVRAEMQQWGEATDRCAAFLRDTEGIRALRERTGEALRDFFHSHTAADVFALRTLAIHYDTMVTRYAVLSAMLDYVRDGGMSRGSYLIDGDETIDTAHFDKVETTTLTVSVDGGIDAVSFFDPVRPIPREERWFEEVYNHFGRWE